VAGVTGASRDAASNVVRPGSGFGLGDDWQRALAEVLDGALEQVDFRRSSSTQVPSCSGNQSPT